MSLTVRVQDGKQRTKTLAVEGRLDDQTAGQLDHELERALGPEVKVLVFDLAALDYVSSAGLRSLFKAHKVMIARGGKTLFVNLKPPVQKVFDIVKAVDVNTVFRSVKELDQYLDAMQRRDS